MQPGRASSRRCPSNSVRPVLWLRLLVTFTVCPPSSTPRSARDVLALLLRGLGGSFRDRVCAAGSTWRARASWWRSSQRSHLVNVLGVRGRGASVSQLFGTQPVNVGPAGDCLSRWAKKGRGASLLRVLWRSFVSVGTSVAFRLCFGGDIEGAARGVACCFTYLRAAMSHGVVYLGSSSFAGASILAY